MRDTRVGLVAGLMTAMWASLGSAGQLHVSYYGLKDVRARDEVVVIGKVESAQQDKRRVSVTLQVTRLFGDPSKSPVKVGESIKRPIYQGVEWTDPHKSPLDERLRGCLHGAPAIGATVALVPSQRGGFELLAASEEALRTLEILYAKDQAALLGGIAEDRLQADLQNHDLADLAQRELQRRGKLSALMILRGDTQFAYQHYRALGSAEKIAFLKQVVAASSALDHGLRVRAARVTLSQLQPEVLPTAAQLVNLLDWRDPEERRALDDVRLGLHELVDTPKATAPVDLTPMCDYLAEALLRRESHRDTDDMTVRLIGRCDRPTRARLAARLLGEIYTSSRARGDDPDGFLLGTAVELAQEAPSAALWVPLQALDPNRPRVTSTKERILTAMVEVGLALAKHDAQFKERVRDLIGPLLGGGLSIDEKLLETFRKMIGELPRGAPKATILELRLGERRRLASGEVVSIKADKDGQFLNLAALDGSSEERALEPASDFYREWFIPPYLVVVKRVGKAVNLRFTPMEKDPAISPADAYEMAKKICDRRGQRELVSQDPRDYDGLFVYIAESQGQAGKQTCKITIGLRTKRVMFAP